MTGHPSFCLPILPFISEGVAAWQSSGNAERKSESIRDLVPVDYFANRVAKLAKRQRTRSSALGGRRGDTLLLTAGLP